MSESAAGRGLVEQIDFHGLAKRFAGIDTKPEVHQNPSLDEAKILELPKTVIPYPGETFDLAFANSILESFGAPIRLLEEVRRVLRSGGVFLAKAPNRRPCRSVIARHSPTRILKVVNRRRRRTDHDTFSTYRRSSSAGDVTRPAERADLSVRTTVCAKGRPECLRLIALSYACGRVCERFVNSIPSLDSFRCVLLFELAKPMR